MIRKQRDNVVWYEFELLQPFPYVRHGCFPFLNVVSSGPDPTVAENRRQIATALFQSSEGRLIEVNQVHGTDIAIISSNSSPSGTYDAMATSLNNIALLIKHADCQAALFFDPEHRVIASVHCGWKGSVQNIYKAVIARLRDEWGTREQALIVCIAPSLGPCHAEFANWKEELPASFEPFRQEEAFAKASGESHFDFPQISRHQLLSCGIAPSHIEIAEMCTYCHPELFFSYRRDKTIQRNATCIALT